MKKISIASDRDKFTVVFYGFLFLCDSNNVSCRDGSHEIHCEKSSSRMGAISMENAMATELIGTNRVQPTSQHSVL